MRTLVVSDLHLGKTEANDLLRRAELREPLLEALEGVDRFVILGDGLELREAPHRDAVEIAAPFFADVGRAGKEVIVLVRQPRSRAGRGLDRRPAAERAGRLPRARAALRRRRRGTAGAPARRRWRRCSSPIPGIWLRDDVYAIHGHYADIHATVPTFERLAAGTMARFVAQLPHDGVTPDDYEAVLSPLYAWLHALTQRADHTIVSKGGGASSRSYTALTRRSVRALPIQIGYRAAVAALNARRLRAAAVEPVADRAAPRLPDRLPGDDRAARHPRRST